MHSSKNSRYFYTLVRLSSITRTIIYNVSHTLPTFVQIMSSKPLLTSPWQMIQGDSSHPHQALQAILIIRLTKKQLLVTQFHCARVLYEQYAPQVNLAEVIEDGNKKGWFKSTRDLNETIQVKQAQLVHDMKVRWDSLYFMINRLRKLCPVCLNSIIL